MNPTHETDILIIGAGPAGAATALFLAKEGVESLLVDKAAFPRDKICGDALSGKVVEVLKKLNPELVESLAGEQFQLGSWGVTFVAPNLKPLRIPFGLDNSRYRLPPGFLAKRLDFDHFLFNQVKSKKEVQVLEQTQLTSFSRDGNYWIAANKENTAIIKAKLIIACDGAQSVFARQHGGINLEHSHYCGGIRAYYSGVKDLDSENFIELHFLKDFLPGYFWIFPLPNGEANVGLGMRSDYISKKKLNLKTELERIVTTHPVIAKRFSDARLLEPVKGFGLPLGSKKRNISGDGFLLTGDAASLIDPFTGEGIGNAMMSGMFAARQASSCVAAQRWDAQFLSQYDEMVYHRLWDELLLSYRMQQLVRFPWLFNLVVNKANSNRTLRETISCMFEDLDLRDRLRSPSFYFKLLFSQ